ncbi:MAG: methane monooxygenase/ammonia monooxygenase subunit C, partial [Pseudomonadota bacterium]|nr:methane monooxygenase/ammonia monooxygenase subunit C [Pseudomonadota bacterium]
MASVPALAKQSSNTPEFNVISPSKCTQAPKVPWLAVATGILIAGCFFIIYRWYQHTYAFTVGLDYFEPEFQTYWMSLLWFQIVVLGAGAVIAPAILWFTRERDLSQLAPQDELWRYYLILSLLALGSVLTMISLGVFAEADAAWHQITIRDTDFTPTHIGLQYFAIPAFAVFLVFGFVWVHTRLPAFTRRISIPAAILVCGPLLMMPNVGFNEWGHAFFYAEELFAAPIHWGFLVFGWSAFGLAGFLMQCLREIRRLTTLDTESA